MEYFDINRYFDAIFCINLDRRPDRWECASKEFERMGLEVSRVPGVDLPDNPSLGCSKSHEKVLSLILNEGLTALILEDDVVFKPDALERFSEAMTDPLQHDWDALWLGGNHVIEPEPTDWLHKITYTLTTSAYAVTPDMACEMLCQIQRFNEPVDMMFARIMPANRCYTFYPGIASQRSGWSDIEGKNVDYDNLIK